MTNSQNSEGSAYNYTGRIYDLDFFAGSEVVPAIPSIPTSKARQLMGLVGSAFISTFTIFWEAFVFTVVFLVYLQKKLVSFVYFLEELKDILVRVLMWRRGLLFRPATHLGLIGIASTALVIGGLFKDSVTPTDFTRDLVLAAANTPETLIPAGRPRSEIIKVKVAEGQTLSAIASAYNVSVDSIKWANGMNSDTLKPGDELLIPPVSGIIHKVKAGETINSIAQTYKASAQGIADYPFNYIDETLSLKEGQTIIVPGGVKPEPVRRFIPPAPAFVAAGNGLFAWPIGAGFKYISQYASWWHTGVDLAADYGTGVYAADGGKVVTKIAQNYSYGYHIIIDHGNGYQTLYSHLSSFNVNEGQTVAKGQLIGRVGCTGRCTGPHLHFEVRRGSSFINPLSFF